MATSKPTKGSHYRRLFERMTEARRKRFYFEAIWFAYAIIEDRANSAIQLGGRKPGRNLGSKLKKLQHLAAAKTPFRRAFFDPKLFRDLKSWTRRRNTLMHDLGNMVKPEKQLRDEAYELSSKGNDLARDVAACVMRLKKELRK